MDNRGFTLIELMIVVAIIGLLATAALPNLIPQVVRTKLADVDEITGQLKPVIVDYYRSHGRFPRDNAAAGLPAPEQLLGTHVSRIDIVDGAMHVRTRGIGHGHDGVITVRPQFVAGSPRSPVTWICGYREPAEGMRAAGENRTDLPRGAGLPGHCRQ